MTQITYTTYHGITFSLSLENFLEDSNSFIPCLYICHSTKQHTNTLLNLSIPFDLDDTDITQNSIKHMIAEHCDNTLSVNDRDALAYLGYNIINTHLQTLHS